MNRANTRANLGASRITPQSGWIAFGGLALAAGCAGLASAQSAGSLPVGTFTIRVNGGAVHAVQAFAVPDTAATAGPGSVRFQGSILDPGGQWESTFDYSGELDPNGNAKLVGSASVLNKSSEAAEFDVRFAAPVCPHIETASKLGGACTVKLTANENGGAISTQVGNAVFIGMADEVAGPKLFHGPFNMGTTGSGTAQTQNVFGAPFPSFDATEMASDFGPRHLFKLTDGDKADVTVTIVAGGDPVNFVECKAEELASGGSETGGANDSGGAESAGGGSAPMVVQGAPSSTSVTVGARENGGKVVISGNSGSGSRKAAPQRSTSKPSRSTSGSRSKR